MNGVEWKQIKDDDRHHTAETMYVTDGYIIWKGKYRIYSTIYSSNAWHLERLSDHRIIWSALTAKECKENFEWARRMAEE